MIGLDLKALVENLGHKVIGVARTRTEAVAIARTKPPGLILSDIQLADGSSGLDAVDDLLNTFEVPVIFITAYPERFLTGLRPEPALLVSKPYQPATVSALVSQALFFERNAIQPKKKRVGSRPPVFGIEALTPIPEASTSKISCGHPGSPAAMSLHPGGAAQNDN
jgi:CheY-like chemotaxis protein